LSQDNKYLITTSLDRTIKLWELGTGKEIENNKVESIINENKMELN